MSNYIYNEIPSGLIDGINKIFTTINEIDNIEDIYIGNAPYRKLSFSGNIITLQEAPPIGATINVDYFKKDITPITIEGTVTFGSVIDDIYDKIGQTRAGNKVFKEGQIKTKINTFLGRLNKLRYYSYLTQRYSFNKANLVSVNEYNATYLNVGIHNYIPSNGCLLLGDTLVNYTSYSDGKIYCAPGIVYKPNLGVNIGYKIPNGIEKISEVFIDGNKLEYTDNRDYVSSNGHYTIINGYLFLPYYGEGIVTVSYHQLNNILSNDGDIVNIPYDYFEVISYYILYSIFNLREDNRANIMKNDYEEILKIYKSYMSRRTDGVNNEIKSNILNNIG